MKHYPNIAVLLIMFVSLSNAVFADNAQRQIVRDEQVRQSWADFDHPVPPGDYTIRIDDRTFSMTIPEGRTAASYHRNTIDTKYYREQIFDSGNRSEPVIGLVGIGRKHQSGVWPLVRTYGETSFGSGIFLTPEWESKIDRTSGKAWMWADYTTLESLVKKTKGFNYVYDDQGNRLGKMDIPRDVVVINGRQWARKHYEKAAIVDLPEETIDTYYTGLSANSYIRLIIRYPYTASRYPKDKERPEWVKESSAFITEALSSIKISPPTGSTEPDFFTVDGSQNTPLDLLAP